MSNISKLRLSGIVGNAVRSMKKKHSTLSSRVRTVVNGTETLDNGQSWSRSISFTSPEADFTSQVSVEDAEALKNKKAFMDHVQKNEELRNDMTYSLAQASSGNDFINPIFVDLLDHRMKHQLENSTEPLKKNVVLSGHVNPREVGNLNNDHQTGGHVQKDHDSRHFHRRIFEGPIPRTLQEASSPDDSRAIVITEAAMPFRIVSVNTSWENLCGFSQNECKGKTLRILQGEETDKYATTALMSQLLKGEEAGILLTNYTKEGRKFHNRLRAGPLRNNDGKVTHFVAVLKEVNEIGEHFDGSMMHP